MRVITVTGLELDCENLLHERTIRKHKHSKRKLSIFEPFHLTPFEVQVVDRMVGREKSHGCCYSRNTCMIK